MDMNIFNRELRKELGLDDLKKSERAKIVYRFYSKYGYLLVNNITKSNDVIETEEVRVSRR